VLLQSLRRSLFHVPLLTFCLSLLVPSTANAIAITGNLNWTGTGGNTLTGTFTGEDANNDGIIQAVSPAINSGIGINEFTFLTVTLTDITAPLSQTYNIGELIGFNSLNFNYDIVNGTILQSLDSIDVLQGSAPLYSAGLSIGDDSNGFALQSNIGSGLSFLDNINFNSDGGGTLTATPVPFEPNASTGFLTLGALWGVNQWRKYSLKK
jgi:hypothetical protein